MAGFWNGPCDHVRLPHLAWALLQHRCLPSREINAGGGSNFADFVREYLCASVQSVFFSPRGYNKSVRHILLASASLLPSAE